MGDIISGGIHGSMTPAKRRSTLVVDSAFAVAGPRAATLCLMRSRGAHQPTILNAH